MNWIKSLKLNELPEGEKRVVNISDHQVLLINHQTKIYAVKNKCPHLNLPLQKATISEDNAIVCPWHRSAFDLSTGNVKDWSPWPPMLGKLLGCLSREKALKTFQTKIENGTIMIGID